MEPHIEHNWWDRCEIADRIDPDLLPEMMKDIHSEVRWRVARRIDPARLHEMMKDPSWLVRLKVAGRIPRRYLASMLIRETDPEVLEIIQEKLSQPTRMGV